MPDPMRKKQSVSPAPNGGGDDGPSPSSPDVGKPKTEDLLKRMRKVDPEQAKRYRQRTGE
ncbi:MAG: ubiquitin-like protein UBact [Opitutales bacterium]